MEPITFKFSNSKTIEISELGFDSYIDSLFYLHSLLEENNIQVVLTSGRSGEILNELLSVISSALDANYILLPNYLPQSNIRDKNDENRDGESPRFYLQYDSGMPIFQFNISRSIEKYGLDKSTKLAFVDDHISSRTKQSAISNGLDSVSDDHIYLVILNEGKEMDEDDLYIVYELGELLKGNIEESTLKVNIQKKVYKVHQLITYVSERIYSSKQRSEETDELNEVIEEMKKRIMKRI